MTAVMTDAGLSQMHMQMQIEQPTGREDWVKDTVARAMWERFEPVHQRGSHVKLRRVGPDGTAQTLTVPRHRELDGGTLRAIVRQASRHIDDSALRLYSFVDSHTPTARRCHSVHRDLCRTLGR